MKISIEIDCTPEEARAFFGLPDLAPVQKAFLDAAGARLAESVGALDPETLFKAWLPVGLKGFEEWRKAFGPGPGEASDEKEEK